MAKAGRPRRVDAPRDDKGRVVRNSYRNQADDPTSLNKWNLIREDLLRQSSSPAVQGMLSTLRGRMFMIGEPVRITAAEFKAGNELASILADYDALVLGISRSIHSPLMRDESPGGGSGREPPDDVIIAAREDMREAEEALGTAGPDIANATKALCRDESAALGRLAALGLQVLVKHWRLDASETDRRRTKKAEARNAENAIAGRAEPVSEPGITTG